ncbi:hypothetical protein JCM16106_03340 [Hydrogenophilus islandicus]
MAQNARPPQWLVALWFIVGLFFLVWHRGETVPRELPDAPQVEENGTPRLPCLSYSPYYRPGVTPYDPKTVITPAWIDEDLQALSRITRCIRTYSVDQGLDRVPEIAERYGLTVWLGAWIGRDDVKNQKELARAIELANRYRGTVTRLIVGNEVLLRREQTPEGLARYLEAAKRASTVPVTYADVWEFWLRYREPLLPHVDLATIHILPYWEDRPQPVEEAAEHLFRIRTMARQVLGGVPIAIGETGWPSAGKQREGAVPSLVNQARYVRDLLSLADTFGWEVNFIESHDQPWKRASEGTVGGFWGLLDVTGTPKFPLTGPVAERTSLWPVLTWALFGALLLAALASRPRWQYALLGAALGFVAHWQWEHGGVAYRTPLEWWVLGTVGVASLAVATLLAVAPKTRDNPPNGLRLAVYYLTFALAVGNLWLTVDGRYRDFATCLFLPLALVAPLRSWPLTFAERLWGGVALLCSLFVWLREAMNGQALLWMLTTLLIVLAFSRLGTAPRASSATQGALQSPRS